MTIAVFGATGKVGNHFIKQALDKGYNLCVLVRDKSKFAYNNNDKIEVFVGNATNSEDVKKTIAKANVVVSCLGNSLALKNITIMYESHNNILNEAVKMDTKPRCMIISSIGCGGSSWLIKQMLSLIGGKVGWNDYEKSDKRVREEQDVPFVLVRPYALNDNKGINKYKTSKKKSITFAKSISREDVAKFFIDCVEDTQYDNGAVMITGA